MTLSLTITEDIMDRFDQAAAEITAGLTAEEKIHFLSTHHFACERIGAEEFYIGTEVARGYVGREPEKVSTVFPQPIGLAATFDRELMQSLGGIAGKESRAYYNRDGKGGLMLWGPTVDMERDPRWGRNEEAYGEDVMLAGELTAAYTLGMAGITEDGHYMTVPTLKHFCADNNEEDRGNCDAFLPPRLKHEYYYAAFENAIRFGGARSIMAAYNEINGLPAVMNPDIEAILKDEWGLWFTVSDGGDISQNVTAHKCCGTMAESVARSLRGGCDVMTDVSGMVHQAARDALDRGLITMEDIDRSVRRTLAARLRLGQSIGGYGEDPFAHIDMSVVDCEEHRRINRRAAQEQVVLLKNDGILPLTGRKRIAVCGPLADENLRDWYTGYFSYSSSIRQGFETAGFDVTFDSLWDIVTVRTSDGRYLSADEGGNVRAVSCTPGESEMFELQHWGGGWKNLFSVKYKRYVRLCDDEIRLAGRTIYDWFTRETWNFKEHYGQAVIEDFLMHMRLSVRPDGTLYVKHSAVRDDCLFTIDTVSSGRDRAAALARCGTVIYCTGNHPVQYAKECYDRQTLTLEPQQGMTEHLASLCDTILVIVSGYPYSVVKESEAARAVVWTSHAGAELGDAVCGALTGRFDPSGHLPETWYRSELDLPDILDYDIETAGSTYMYFEGTPLYPFGHGLSYAEFEYLDMGFAPDGDDITAKVTVRNISDRDGTAVVQIYFTVRSSALSRPKRKLCGFARADIPAGHTVEVNVRIPRHILRVYDVRAHRMFVEGGRYVFMAGASSADIRLERALDIEGDALSARADRFGAADFDSHEHIRIYRARDGREYVRSSFYSGRLVYDGISPEGIRRIHLMISSLTGERPVKLRFGGREYTADVPPCGSFDSFTEIVTDIDTSGASLEIILSDQMSLQEVYLER